MLKIGLTGGIGSGKSTVAKIFESLQIPIFNADSAAKWIMSNNETVKQKLINLFGPNIYLPDGQLNKTLIAQLIFQDQNKKQQLEKIVHPAVEQLFINWSNQQSAPYVIKESALLFETGNYKKLDYIITVYSPQQLRIERTKKRSNLSEKQIQQRILNQLDDKIKYQKAHFVIINTHYIPILPQVLNLHKFFLKQSVY